MTILDDSYCSFVNIDSRPDRLDSVVFQFHKHGIKNFVRQRGMLPHEYAGDPKKVEVMMKRTPGAVGCHYSQVQIMIEAEKLGKHAFVCEDDIILCEDFNERLSIIESFLAHNKWDIFWFGGTYHKEPTWHKNPHPHDMRQCNCNLNRDYEPTTNERVVRTFGAFATYCYLVNKNSIGKILKMLDENVHLSMGIDWEMMLLQPKLKTFAFVPGCVKQMDNMSNIGNGMTYFSGFEKLGEHWYKERM